MMVFRSFDPAGAPGRCNAIQGVGGVLPIRRARELPVPGRGLLYSAGDPTEREALESVAGGSVRDGPKHVNSAGRSRSMAKRAFARRGAARLCR